MVRKNSFTITTLIFLFAKKLNLPDNTLLEEHIRIIAKGRMIFSVKLEYGWLNDCIDG